MSSLRSPLTAFMFRNPFSSLILLTLTLFINNSLPLSYLGQCAFRKAIKKPHTFFEYTHTHTQKITSEISMFYCHPRFSIFMMGIFSRTHRRPFFSATTIFYIRIYVSSASQCARSLHRFLMHYAATEIKLKSCRQTRVEGRELIVMVVINVL